MITLADNTNEQPRVYLETAAPVTSRSSVAYRIVELINALATTDDPEAIAEFESMIDDGADEFREYVSNVLAMAGELEQTIAGLRSEQDRIHALVLERQQRVDRLRTAVKTYMETLQLSEILTDLYTVRIRRNPASVVIDDETVIAESYKRVKVTETIDKKAIAEALKAGAPVEGARLAHTTRLEIK